MLVSPNQPIHPDFHERISVKVQGQLPQFVKEDHETFVAFMEAYYEYMEQQGKPYEIIGSLDNYANVDKTVDEFLNYFKKQFGEDIPEAVFANANKPFVLKHLRDFYRTKGSEKAFQFLFRLLYQEEITINTPGRDILRSSDGKYDSEFLIRTMDMSDEFSKLEGKRITGETSGATALVEVVITEILGTYCITTMFLSEVTAEFQADEVVTYNNISFTIGNIIIDHKITNAGTGYFVNNIIPLSGNDDNSGALIRVKEVTSGRLTSATINNGGSGYKNGDKFDIDNTNNLAIDGRSASLIVSEVDSNGSIVQVWIENSGSGYIGVPSISGGSGTDADITFDVTDSGIGGVKSLEIISSGFGYNVPPVLDFSVAGDGNATAELSIGGFDTSPRTRFINSDGFLSSDKYLQDNFFYQLFSYEITSTENIIKWRDIVKRLVHPAGLALFARLQLVTIVEAPLSLTNVIPDTRDRYTIVFHDGTIQPPVILDLTLETCDDQQDIRSERKTDDYGGFDLDDDKEDYQPPPEILSTVFSSEEDFQPDNETLSSTISTQEDYGQLVEPAATIREADRGCPGDEEFPFTEGICSPTNFGLITDGEINSGVLNLEPEDYGRIKDPFFFFFPTMCQVYEQEWWPRLLTELDGYDDYNLVIDPAGSYSGRTDTQEDYGSVVDPSTERDDYGYATFHNTFFSTQLNLGPILRTQDRVKFQSRFRTLDNIGVIDRLVLFDGGSGFSAVPSVTIEAPLEGGVNGLATPIFERLVLPDFQNGVGNGTTNPLTLTQVVTDISHIIVSVNGLIYTPGVDYTVNGTALIFDEIVLSGDDITVYYVNINPETNFQVGDGDGTTIPLVLSQSVSNAESILVSINGLTQIPNIDYTVDDTVLTFDEVVNNGDTIIIHFLGLDLTNIQVGLGDDTTNPIILSQSVANVANMVVSVNGLIYTPNVDYTVVGTTLTFDEPVNDTDTIVIQLLDTTPRVHPINSTILSLRLDNAGTGYEIDVPSVIISISETGVTALATTVLQRGSYYNPISYVGNDPSAPFVFFRGKKTNRVVDPIITQYSLIEDPDNVGDFFETTPPFV